MSGCRYGIWPKITVIRVFLVIAIVAGLLSGCAAHRPSPSKAVAVDRVDGRGPGENPGGLIKPGFDGKVSVDISLVGDIMMHLPQISAAYDNRTGRYSFDGFFSDVKTYLSSADLTIGNLETTLAGPDSGYTGYPRFNSPQEILPALKEAGFDVLTTANNHSMDRGVNGVLKTIEHLDAAGIEHTGTFSSLIDRNRSLVIEKKGVKIGFAAYTYGTNGIPVPKDKPFLVNLLDLQTVRNDIRKIREDGADLVVVLPHFGTEYRRQPNDREKQIVEGLFAAGADFVAGSHTHVIQPMFRRDLDKNLSGLFAAYSLGNFISAQRSQYKDSGIILNLSLEKDMATGKITLVTADYIPTWVHRYRSQGKTMYRVVAVEKAVRDYEQGLDKKITVSDYQRLKQVWQETTSIFTRPGSPVIRHI